MGIFDRSTQSMLFESEEEITFPDGTAANIGDIRLRSLSIRPQRSEKGELFGVFNMTFAVDDIMVSGPDGEAHPLAAADDQFSRAFNKQVNKRVETEKWVSWDRVTELMPLVKQVQQAGYEIESNKMSYAQVTQWFRDNDKKTTFGKKDNTWINVRSSAGQRLLPAQFVGRIGELQEGTTKSLNSGYDDLSLLISEQAEALKSGQIDPEVQRQFNMLIGNVLGFHEDNKGNRWGNKIAVNAVTVDGEEYSLYFNSSRERVEDLDALFDKAQERASAQPEQADVEAIFGDA